MVVRHNGFWHATSPRLFHTWFPEWRRSNPVLGVAHIPCSHHRSRHPTLFLVPHYNTSPRDTTTGVSHRRTDEHLAQRTDHQYHWDTTESRQAYSNKQTIKKPLLPFIDDSFLLDGNASVLPSTAGWTFFYRTCHGKDMFLKQRML